MITVSRERLLHRPPRVSPGAPQTELAGREGGESGPGGPEHPSAELARTLLDLGGLAPGAALILRLRLASLQPSHEPFRVLQGQKHTVGGA